MDARVFLGCLIAVATTLFCLLVWGVWWLVSYVMEHGLRNILLPIWEGVK